MGQVDGRSPVRPLRAALAHPDRAGCSTSLGAAGCALAQGPLTLDAARFVEAVGGCAGTVLARACVRDLFPPQQAARIFAQMLLILSVSPLFAPFVGGWLLPLTGWRSLFWLQGGAALLTWGFVWWLLPESHPGSDRRLHPLHVLKDYWTIARDRRFFRFVIPATLTGAGLYVFLTGWPHVVIDIFHVAPAIFRLHLCAERHRPDRLQPERRALAEDTVPASRCSSPP